MPARRTRIRDVLAHALPFEQTTAAAVLAQLPDSPAVFALGFGERREPYLARTANLRRRLSRMLAPAGALSRRVQLLPFVQQIAWSPYGSEFEASLLLYREITTAFTAQDVTAVRKRLRLRPPAYLRFSMENEFPRLFATNRYVRSAAARSFGPFATRAAAERTCDAVLDLFQLRRCTEDLAPFPEHPACAYAEMKKCLAPCNQSCTPDRHRAEADAVFAALRTHGASLLAALEQERTAASEALEFEAAAAIHQRHARAESVLREIPEAVRLLAELSAVIVQPAADPGEVALFRLLPQGLAGPVSFSTLGMRLHNEQSGSSSLFSHPVALAPVPLEPATGVSATETLEARLQQALSALEELTPARPSLQQTEDHLALFTRWCYQPAVRRVGEAVFADAAGAVPHKPLLRSISRVARATLAVQPAP